MVSQIQAHLEAIYAIQSFARAADFVVDEASAKALGGACRADEELLIVDGEESLEVALYYAPALLSLVRSYETQPSEGEGLEKTMEEALSAYCQIAEGVSHFVYLAQIAAQKRSVSLLELEAQGEIDKFATCVLQRWKHRDGLRHAVELHRRLFDQVSYLAELTSEERARYEEANRLARNYCERLLPHIESRRMDRLLSELRYSYRLGWDAKRQHLAKSL